jgi:peptide/nickel transport system substrate-binding protein
MTALRNKEIDVFYQPTPEQLLQVQNDGDLKANYNALAMDTLTAGYLYIGWNEAKGGKPTYFADKRVRRAMTMLLDRKAMVHDIMHDLATVPSGPYSRLGKQADPAIEPVPFDPDGAKKLLTEAGFSMKNDVLTGPDGKTFQFDLMYVSTKDVSKQSVTYAKDALARAGIVVNLAPVEWSTLLQKTKERNYDAVFLGWGGVVEDDLDQIFSSEAMKGVGDNFVQYSNPEFDRVLQSARFTPDVNKRTELWHQCHRILADDQPYTFVFADKELDAVSRRFKGVEPTKVGIATLKNEWYVPRAQQMYTK